MAAETARSTATDAPPLLLAIDDDDDDEFIPRNTSPQTQHTAANPPQRRHTSVSGRPVLARDASPPLCVVFGGGFSLGDRTQ